MTVASVQQSGLQVIDIMKPPKVSISVNIEPTKVKETTMQCHPDLHKESTLSKDDIFYMLL